MRNLGEQTMIELEEICKAHGIELRSIHEIKENLAPYHLPFNSAQYEGLYRYKITSFDDLKKITTHDLYMICQQHMETAKRRDYIASNFGERGRKWKERMHQRALIRKGQK